MLCQLCDPGQAPNLLCFYFLMCKIGKTRPLSHWEDGRLQDMKKAQQGSFSVSSVLMGLLGAAPISQDTTEAPRD